MQYYLDMLRALESRQRLLELFGRVVGRIMMMIMIIIIIIIINACTGTELGIMLFIFISTTIHVVSTIYHSFTVDKSQK